MLIVRVVLLLLLFSICIGAVQGAEVAVCTDSSDQINPDVYGHYVVWEDHRTAYSRIYLYDIDNGTAEAIANPRMLSSQTEPAIYGDYIVYVSHAKGGDEIILYSITDKTTKVIRQSSDRLETPDVYATKVIVDVVWTEFTPNSTYGMDNKDIYLYTKSVLGLPTITRVSYGLFDSAPRISVNRIVWMHRAGSPMESTTSDNYLVYARTGDAGSPTLISSTDEWNLYPDIQGDRAVWENSMESDAYGMQVLLSTMPFGASGPVTVAKHQDTSLIHHAYKTPAIFGTTVVYVDRDLATGSMGPGNLRIRELGSDTDYLLTSSNHASTPRIYGDTVVWVDDRAGNKDIYIKKTGPTPITAGCTVIDQPGYYTLSADLINSACPIAIDIRCSDVLLDGLGHLVDGQDTAGSTGIQIMAHPTAALTNVTVRNVRLTDWACGLSGMSCSNGAISNVSADSGGTGISLLMDCHANTLSSGSATNNSGDGISITDDSSLDITACTITGNSGNGVYGETSRVSCRDSVIADNGFGSGYGHDGFQFSRAGGDFYNNTIRHNQAAGLFFNHNVGGTIAGNTITGNAVGISDNNLEGEGGGRTIYNNYFNNTLNTDVTVQNTWSVKESPGPNIIGGLKIGGNYWALPNGLGFSQTHPDLNHDGFCEDQYTVTSASFGQPASIDKLPLRPVIQVKIFPGQVSLPLDLNGDGKYNDVNGNGKKDFADVVLYFNQMDWIADNEQVAGFDYNGNGQVDFADVVWLFNEL
jgi:beta propeller repeat protein